MASNDTFQKAAQAVREYTNVTNEEALELYSLYKQSLVGDCNTAQPSVADVTGKAKWAAWNAKKGMSQDDAKQKYIDKAKACGLKF